MEIILGDWVTLDYERFDNREYHGYRSVKYGLSPDEEYEVINIESRAKSPLLTLSIPTKGGRFKSSYKCFEYRVNLFKPGKAIVLWK